MRAMVILFCFWATSVLADTFSSRIHGIDGTGEETIIKFSNSRVAFVPSTQWETITALERLKGGGEVVRVEVGKDYDLKTFTSLGPSASGESPFENYLMEDFSPTVLPNLQAANTIFSKMRSSWQNESQCYNRAHVWAYEAHYYYKLNSYKMFLFFTSRYIRAYKYKWWFHVAPMTVVREGGANVKYVLDRRYAGGPRRVKTWTDIFIKSKRTCPSVTRYSQYRFNQKAEDCYVLPVSMYYWQPRDLETLESSGKKRIKWSRSNLEHAYQEAF